MAFSNSAFSTAAFSVAAFTFLIGGGVETGVGLSAGQASANYTGVAVHTVVVTAGGSAYAGGLCESVAAVVGYAAGEQAGYAVGGCTGSTDFGLYCGSTAQAYGVNGVFSYWSRPVVVTQSVGATTVFVRVQEANVIDV